MRKLNALLPVVLLLPVASCYRYGAVTGPTPAEGMDVRVELTDAGTVQLATAIGQRIESVDGTSVAASDTSITLAVTATNSRSGISSPWNRERVEIPRSAIASVRGRSMDRGRTSLASAIAVAGVVLAARIFGIGSGGLNGFPSHGGGGSSK